MGWFQSFFLFYVQQQIGGCDVQPQYNDGGLYDVWVQITYTYDNATSLGCFYINGAQTVPCVVAGCTIDTPPVTANVGCADDQYYYYSGALESGVWPYNMTNIMYFNTSLTFREVFSLYELTKPR